MTYYKKKKFGFTSHLRAKAGKNNIFDMRALYVGCKIHEYLLFSVRYLKPYRYAIHSFLGIFST